MLGVHIVPNSSVSFPHILPTVLHSCWCPWIDNDCWLKNTHTKTDTIKSMHSKIQYIKL